MGSRPGPLVISLVGPSGKITIQERESENRGFYESESRGIGEPGILVVLFDVLKKLINTFKCTTGILLFDSSIL